MTATAAAMREAGASLGSALDRERLAPGAARLVRAASAYEGRAGCPDGCDPARPCRRARARDARPSRVRAHLRLDARHADANPVEASGL